MKKEYNFRHIEKDKYDFWKNQGYFRSGINIDSKPFTIVIPPPNVTGKLHLGHAWDQTLQDIIIRRKRMQGYDALYLPEWITQELQLKQKLIKDLENQVQIDISLEEKVFESSMGMEKRIR